MFPWILASAVAYITVHASVDTSDFVLVQRQAELLEAKQCWKNPNFVVNVSAFDGRKSVLNPPDVMYGKRGTKLQGLCILDLTSTLVRGAHLGLGAPQMDVVNLCTSCDAPLEERKQKICCVGWMECKGKWGNPNDMEDCLKDLGSMGAVHDTSAKSIVISTFVFDYKEWTSRTDKIVGRSDAEAELEELEKLRGHCETERAPAEIAITNRKTRNGPSSSSAAQLSVSWKFQDKVCSPNFTMLQDLIARKLREERMIPGTVTECAKCEGWANEACCLHSLDITPTTTGKLNGEYELAWQRGMGPDLAILIEAEFPDLSAEEKASLAKDLIEMGVLEKAELGSADLLAIKNKYAPDSGEASATEEAAVVVAEQNGTNASVAPQEPGVSRQIPGVLERLAAEEESEAMEEPDPDDAEDVAAMEEARKAAGESRREASETVEALRKEQAQAVEDGNTELIAASKERLDAAVAQLERLQLQEADLGMAVATSTLGNVDETSQSLGVIGGRRWNIKKLIAYNGLFNGVKLSDTIDTVGLSQVVSLRSQYSGRKNSGLRRKVYMQPPMESTEYTIQSTSASEMQKAERTIEEMGFSAFKSSEAAASLGVASYGAASASKSKSSGESSSQQSSSQNEEQQISQSMVKTRYFFQPTALIHIDKAMLQPSSEFSEATSEVQKLYKKGDEKASGRAITALFARFGTHICPRALLGGWWKVEASYRSDTAMSTTDMSQAATVAMDEATSSGLSVEGSYGMVNAGASKSNAETQTSESTSGVASKSREQQQGSSMDVKQAWKGGVAGGSKQEWRQSLTWKTNSHWRVIDRYPDTCLGVWTWVKDSTLREAMCSKWRDSFMAGLDLAAELKETLLGDACEGGASTVVARNSAIDASKTQADQKLQEAKTQCATQAGMHWEDGTNTCAQNVCKCDNGEASVTGLDCPTHGSMVCLDSQKGKCSAFSCSSAQKLELVADAATKICKTSKCTVGECCKDLLFADKFSLTIATTKGWKNGHGSSYTAKARLSQGGTKSEWELTGDFDDGKQRTVSSPNLKTMKPSQLCLYSSKWDKWVIDYAVVYVTRWGDATGRVGRADFKDTETKGDWICAGIV